MNSYSFEKQAYTALFNVLDKCYDETKDSSLGSLLSDMNPDLFDESDSADPVVFEDFSECIKVIYGKSFTADARTAFLASMQFLRHYRDDFGFDIDDIIKQIDYEDFEEAFQKL